MAIFRECKHSFQIVQALFGKSASTLVFSTAKVRISPESLRTLFAGAKVIHSAGESGTFRVPRPSGDGYNAGGKVSQIATFA